MSCNPKIYGIILANGKSRRMGCNKLLLPFQEKHLIEHVLLKAIQAELTEILVVLPKEDLKLQHVVAQYPCQTVWIDIQEQQGMGLSLATAMTFLPSTAKAIIVLLADQPGIQSKDIRSIKDQFLKVFIHKKGKVPSLIRTMYSNGQEGHPVLFSYHFFSQLTQLQGDVGGKEIISRNRHFIQLVHSQHPFPQDVDTPSDYLQLVTLNQEDSRHE